MGKITNIEGVDRLQGLKADFRGMVSWYIGEIVKWLVPSTRNQKANLTRLGNSEIYNNLMNSKSEQ